MPDHSFALHTVVLAAILYLAESEPNSCVGCSLVSSDIHHQHGLEPINYDSVEFALAQHQ